MAGLSSGYAMPEIVVRNERGPGRRALRSIDRLPAPDRTCKRLPAGTPAALRLAVHRHKMVSKKAAR